MRTIIICADCRQERPLLARGRCKQCYFRERYLNPERVAAATAARRAVHTGICRKCHQEVARQVHGLCKKCYSHERYAKANPGRAVTTMEARSAAAKAPCIQCGQPRNARSSGKGLCGSCYQRAYRATNPEKLKAWRDSRPVERKANAQRYIERHPGSVYARTKAWREKNRDAFFVHLQRRRALKANAPINDFTAEQWTAVQEAAGGRCHYCHEVKPLSMDHVVPLVKGGAHTAANIVPACRRCNSRKRAKSYEEFMAVLAAEAVA